MMRREEHLETSQLRPSPEEQLGNCVTVAMPPLDLHGSQTMVAVVTGTEARLPAGPSLTGEGSLLNLNLCEGGAGGGVPPSDLIHEFHLRSSV